MSKNFAFVVLIACMVMTACGGRAGITAELDSLYFEVSKEALSEAEKNEVDSLMEQIDSASVSMDQLVDSSRAYLIKYN